MHGDEKITEMLFNPTWRGAGIQNVLLSYVET